MSEALSCRNFTRSLKNNSRRVAGLGIRRPPAGDCRSTCFQRTSRIHRARGRYPFRGLTYAGPPRDAYLTMRVVRTQIAADCRGVRAGVTQFVVTNEHNMIMSRDRAARYTARFVTRASPRTPPPPLPPAAPCHLFTSVNTSPIGIPIPRSGYEPRPKPEAPLENKTTKLEPAGVLAFFSLAGECEVRCLMHY